MNTIVEKIHMEAVATIRNKNTNICWYVSIGDFVRNIDQHRCWEQDTSSIEYSKRVNVPNF